ncbi:hypothetical protein [Streptomyces flavofungini]|uniref:hypothetical protein n=1 Tax=Streptomyces flavofungini TaxID=68200 RepID=UPI0025B25240|nr:hypothetical protein [Streptomyces flavofungini]WJV46936.1 hypothetical protein QUY26_16210 [Streptomyces flavofungini]
MNATTPDLDEQATKLYRNYLGHLWGCPSCRTAHYCAVGNHMRRAWKAAQSASVHAHRAARAGGAR